MADIEFVDREFGHIRVPAFRKIKFKQVSFTNISERFKNYRLDRLKSKLISNKEKLVSMEFKGSQLVPGNSREKVEKKILNKTAAIARLESKINFLETGSYLTEDFINSRAIKLKETMMHNFEYNRANLYGVNKATKEAIINGAVEVEPEKNKQAVKQEQRKNPEQKSADYDAQMLETQEQIAAAVKNIMAEDNQEKKQTVPPVASGKTPEAPKASVEIPVASQVKVETPIASQKQEQTKKASPTPVETPSTSEADVVSKEEVKDSISAEMNNIDVAEPISAEELAEAINREMQKIKVSSNESKKANVNKFINEDGTYRLKREDIDEDFRITRIDRSKLPKDRTIVAEENAKPEVPPFAKSVERRAPSMEMPRKAVTKMPEPKSYKFSPPTVPTIKESFFNSQTPTVEEQQVEDAMQIREIALVVPERKAVAKQQDYEISPEQKKQDASTDAIKNIELNEDIQAYLNKATVLNRDLKRIEEGYAQEEAALQQTEQRYDETVDQFVDYVNSLENKCNATYQEWQQMREGKQMKEEQISMMMNMMGQGFAVPEVQRARHR